MIAIGPAAVVNRREARCPTSFSGEKPFVVYGIDTFQALALAVRYVSMRLERMTADGWRFFCRRNDASPLPVVAVWGQRSPLWPTAPSWSTDGSRGSEDNRDLGAATDIAIKVISSMRLIGPLTRSRLVRDVLAELRSVIEARTVAVSAERPRKAVPFGGAVVSPSLALHAAGTPLVALELDVAKSARRVNGALCRAVGRALVHRLMYPRVVVSLVANVARSRDVTDDEFARRLAEVGIFVRVKPRRRAASGRR